MKNGHVHWSLQRPVLGERTLPISADFRAKKANPNSTRFRVLAGASAGKKRATFYRPKLLQTLMIRLAATSTSWRVVPMPKLNRKEPDTTAGLKPMAM